MDDPVSGSYGRIFLHGREGALKSGDLVLHVDMSLQVNGRGEG